MGRSSYLSDRKGGDTECLLVPQAVVWGLPSGLPSVGGEETDESGKRLDLGRKEGSGQLGYIGGTSGQGGSWSCRFPQAVTLFESLVAEESCGTVG